MRLLKKLVSALLCASVIFSVLLCATTAQAAGALTYTDTFSESFEEDLSQWEAVGMENGFENDFRIVEDPADSSNKALYFTQQGSILVPKSDYWPADGQMSTVTFRMKFNSMNFSGVVVPFTFRDSENYMGAAVSTTYGGNTGIFGKYAGMVDGEGVSAGGAPEIQDFASTDWFDVTITYSNNGFSVSLTDKNNTNYAIIADKTVVDGKFPIGIINRNSGSVSNDISAKNCYYIDDIKITFSKLAVDKDVEQKDVVVYYAGNSRYDPGDLISITGEQLGVTVSGATILKLQDGALSSGASSAKYINETDYETYATANVDWATLQAKAVAGTERSLDILQRSKLGVKVSIPDDGEYAEFGIYAIKLEAATEDGEDAIVIVNNPYISLLLHDDGEAATPYGWLQIAGYNLNLHDSASDLSAIIIDSKGNRSFVSASDISVCTSAMNEDASDSRTNEYYVKIDLDGLTPGDYQIMLHNGHGGDLGWSMPYDFTVKAEAAVDTWKSNGTFNVKDFGAVGDSYHNDTAAIIQALNAAYEAGGGTVYLPAGFYRITDTLYLPDKVSLVGDGMYESAIFFDANNWTETPASMVVFDKNVEIADLYFYGSIARVLFNQREGDTAGGHVYFRNVRTVFDAWAYCSDGVGALMEGYNSKAAQLYIKEQGGTGSGGSGSSGDGDNKGFATIHTKGEPTRRAAYISVTNCEFDHVFGQLPNYQCNIDLHADYLNLDGLEFTQWSKVAPSEAGFIQNTVWDRGSLNFYGNCYFYNLTAGDSTGNNCEILNTDGQPRYKNQVIQSLNDDTVAAEVLAEEKEKLSQTDYEKLKKYIEDNQGVVFRTITSKITYDAETANMIYVAKGQGAGQVREINDNILSIGDYSYFTVKNAFAVEPNRNSNIFIFGERRRGFLINSDFYNCRTVGVYGSYADFVSDGVHLDGAESGIRFSPSQGQNWYLTERNTVAENIITYHTDRMFHSGAGFSYASDTSSDQAYLGIRIYGNQTGNGGYYGQTNVKASNCREVIFENNVFYSSDGKGYSEFNGSFEGIYFRNNKQYDASGNPATLTTAYDTDLIAQFRNATINRYGTYSYRCDEYRSLIDAQRFCGDVNNDGFITLRDAELICSYLGGTLTEDDLIELYGTYVLKYAECDGKAGVSSLDVFEIYAYLKDPASYKGRVGTQIGSSMGPVEEYEIKYKHDEVILDYSQAEEEGQDPNSFDLDYSNAEVED